MIINNLDNKKIKILIDKIDLDKAQIPLHEWISNPSKTLSYIEKLLENSNTFLKKIIIKDYLICTYNYKVFLITISI